MAKKWYVIQTYSGYENKVKAALQERIRQYSMEEKFGEILIPTETVQEVRAGGKSRVRQKNSFPGYIFVEMEMSEPVWHLVKDTPKVTGFIGNQTPQEVKPPQIEELRKGIVEGAVKPKPRFSFLRSSDARGTRIQPGGEALVKKVVGYVKLQLPAGKANPSPPVGPALGQHGVNIMGFCKEFNAKSASQGDMIIPVVITVYSDRSFSFVMKTPPASVLLKKAAGLATTKKPGSGAKEPNKNKVGKITTKQLRELATQKLPDMNANDVEAAMRSIAGTARSMGIDIVD